MNPTRRNQEIVAEVLEDEELVYSGEPLSKPQRELQGRALSGKRGRRLTARKGSQALLSPQGSTIESSWLRRLEKALRNTTNFFLKTQHEDGYWWAELESNVTITSEYIMLHFLLGISDPRKEAGMVKYLLHQQRRDGSWGCITVTKEI